MIPFAVFLILAYTLNPIKEKFREKRKRRLSEKIQNIKNEIENSLMITKQPLTLSADFDIILKSNKGRIGCFGFLLTIFVCWCFGFIIPNIYIVGAVFITCCLLNYFLIIPLFQSQSKASICICQDKLELHYNNDKTINFYPSEILSLSLYEVTTESKGQIYLNGIITELNFNEQYLEKNEPQKLTDFKNNFCSGRPVRSKNSIHSKYSRLYLYLDEISLSWNEFFLFRAIPVKNNDKYLRDELIKFCIINSVMIKI
jgi:hypothetical protein